MSLFLEVEESMKKKKLEIELKGKEVKQDMVKLQCNKGKACRFKRSIFTQEEDAASSAMLLLAYVVFAPSVST
ncbi:hypothetical protein J5N97_021068 [Dioscorea zingiberensis]|uniref:Uncharacterized protein n=1 Tax=Dioscorea zingiberensis TaxID=325984 RepID=A0A9D5CHR3_9LILI|nr:hypothetical protein J5N97_021068 [Dioscorea zingiberensis]